MKYIVTFKIISIGCLLLTLIPGEKFSLFYGIVIIGGLLEGPIFQHPFSILPLITILAIIIYFFKELKYFVIAYLALVIGILFFLQNIQRQLDLYFWLPFIAFNIFSIVLIFQSLKHRKYG